MKKLFRPASFLLLALFITLVASCRGPTTDAVNGLPDSTAAAQQEPTADSQPPQPGEAALELIAEANQSGGSPLFSPGSDSPILPAEGEAPLRFTFPTPGPAPKSLWRPPLYDTPWALGPHDHFFFSRPIAADETNWPVADYRYGGTFFSTEIVHTGIDIPTPRNTPVIAAGNGRVVWAGWGLYYGQNDPNDPYGLAVTIRHDFGLNGQRIYTVYAHMDRIDVITGQEVKTGDPLGAVGTTGLTTGPHLHFEVRMERNSYFTTYNPELWLAPPQGWGVLVGRLLNTNGSLLDLQDVYVRSLDTRDRWQVRSYGNQAVNSDPYFKENLVLSDLPAGKYEISIDYLEKEYRQEIEIKPGAITYFTFRGEKGYNLAPPPEPKVDNLIKPYP